mgnify:CR=1 FL=1
MVISGLNGFGYKDMILSLTGLLLPMLYILNGLLEVLGLGFELFQLRSAFAGLSKTRKTPSTISSINEC